MAIKEASVTISTIDTSTRSEQVDSSFNVVAVVNSPTGPYEETLISSVSQLINLYLTSDRLSSNDDTTLLNVAKLLQTMPVRVIRASNSKVRSGITNNGSVIFTDENYSPYLVSNKFLIPDSSGYGCAPFIGITYNNGSGEVKKLFLWDDTNSLLNGYKYPSEITNYTDSANTIKLTPVTPQWGMMSLLQTQLPNNTDWNNIKGIFVESVSNGGWTIYTDENITDVFLPSWIFNNTESDISNNVCSVGFDNQQIQIYDYLSLNGYSFYPETGVTNNYNFPGESVPIPLNPTDSLPLFGSKIFDEISTNSSYPSPLSSIIECDYNVSLTNGSTESTIYANGPLIGKYISTTGTKEAPVTNLKLAPINENIQIISEYTSLEICAIAGQVHNIYINGTPDNYDPTKDALIVGPLTVTSLLSQLPSIIKTFANQDKLTVTSNSYNVSSCSFVGLNSSFRSVSSSNDTRIPVSLSIPGYKRYYISGDIQNISNVKHSFQLELDNYIFYNGDYVITDFSKIYVPVTGDKASSAGIMTQPEFLNYLFTTTTTLDAYFVNISDNSGSFTIFDKSKTTHVCSWTVDSNAPINLTPTIEDYSYELNSRFAVINRYSSSLATSTFGIVKTDQDTYNLTLGMKSDQRNYTVSFTPGVLDGYGSSIYYDYVNNSNPYFYLIDLDTNADIDDIKNLIKFGNEISPKSPQLIDYQSAIEKILLDTGVYYDVIFTAGYDNVSYLKTCNTVAQKKFAQVMSNIPNTLYSAEDYINFRNNVNINNYWSSIFGNWYKDSTIGEFTAWLAPSTAVLEKAYINRLAGMEFAPLFWKTNGRLSITGSNGSALRSKFDSEADRTELLQSQINIIKYDNRTGVYYINDQYTMQTTDSDLSDWNNVRMISVLSHVMDSTMDQFIAQFNDQATREQVVRVATTNINTRMVAGQSYTMNDFKVVCDTSNNTVDIIKARKLVVDVYVKFTPGIRWVLVYQRVVPLDSTL